jgi:hypothetical protein
VIAREACCVAFAIVGCYSPSYIDCQVKCGSDSACPSGLMCDMAANACRSPSSQACAIVADAGPVDAACSSWNGLFPASNFDPCDGSLPPTGSGLNIEQSSTLSTTDGTLAVGSNDPITVGVAYNGMWLIHERSITIDDVVLVTGTLPLVLVADTTITVSHAFDVRATSTNGDSSCVSPDAGANSPVGGGGGGGGYGSDGASGGAESGGAAQAGQSSNGPVTLVPLRFGCGGGAGGSPDGSSPGGAGGDAGAALELAAGTSIVITSQGTLTATGGGGGAGAGSVQSGYSSGGGGGGTGGSILLEAPALEIDGAVCAPGGGGGQGDAAGGTIPSMGTNGTCAGGQGGANEATGGPGGNGGDDSSLSGYAGTSADSGGGGGGSVGRIHFNALPSGLTIGSGVIVPNAQ